jgi:hypothetical protein
MRNAINIYQHMCDFMLDASANAMGGHDDSLDAYSRSGALPGTGVSNFGTILTSLPCRLNCGSGWVQSRPEDWFGFAHASWMAGRRSVLSRTSEVVRRGLCDMALLIFHLVVSSFTFTGVDLEMAETFLNWNSKRVSNWYVPFSLSTLKFRIAHAPSPTLRQLLILRSRPRNKSRSTAVPSDHSQSTFPATPSASGKSVGKRKTRFH